MNPFISKLNPLSTEQVGWLKTKTLGSEPSHFVLPISKEVSMLNKTEQELKDELENMAVETSGTVSLYKTQESHMNSLKKPETTSLVFINGMYAFSGYPYSTETTADKLKDFAYITTKCRFFEANEGTVLRVFNANGEWYTITNKKLDAFRSKWASKTRTFGCHLAISIFSLLNPDHNGDRPNFDDVVVAKDYVNQIWSDSLDISKRYFFLLKSSKEERIVCDAEEGVLNIGVIDKNNNLSLDELVKLNQSSQNSIVLSNPVEHNFSSLDELSKKIDSLDITKCSGLLAIFKTDFAGAVIEADIEKHIHVKILNKRYQQLYSLRGNAPSLRFRLFQLVYLSNREMQLNLYSSYINDFNTLYPQCEGMLNVVWVVVQELFEKYQSIHVKHEKIYEKLPPKMENTLRIIHNEYLISKQPTTLKKITDIISYIEPEQLNQLVREYENNFRKQNKLEQ